MTRLLPSGDPHIALGRDREGNRNVHCASRHLWQSLDHESADQGSVASELRVAAEQADLDVFLIVGGPRERLGDLAGDCLASRNKRSEHTAERLDTEGFDQLSVRDCWTPLLQFESSDPRPTAHRSECQNQKEGA
jgi:hypothetical protein